MEINPSLARLRILENQDSVQMQREAAPDDELAGCPGCPYFWTCPVPHRASNVSAPQEIELADVADQLPARAAYRPRDADDIGWTDQWIEDDEEADADEGDEGIHAGWEVATDRGTDRGSDIATGTVAVTRTRTDTDTDTDGAAKDRATGPVAGDGTDQGADQDQDQDGGSSRTPSKSRPSHAHRRTSPRRGLRGLFRRSR